MKEGSTTIATFEYDGEGRRTEKIAAGLTHTYIYDVEDIVEERITGSSSDTIRYYHGAGIDEPLARKNSGDVVTYYLADHLGSVVQETNAAGAVGFDREYDPWGRFTSGGSVSGYAFTGREWDSEFELFYDRARYYSPERARFLSEDPAGMIDGPNMSSYAANAPTRYVDPSGLAVGDWWDLVSNLRRAREIGLEKAREFGGQSDNLGDAMRHAEWMKQTAEETNTFTAYLAGSLYELYDLPHGLSFDRMIMDLHNNIKGREARDGTIDPKSLITLDPPGGPKIPFLDQYKSKKPASRPYSSYPKSAEGGSSSGRTSCK